MKKNITISGVLLLLFIPLTVSANAGSPLIWSSFFHLIIGNMIIGLLEASFVKRILKININGLLIILGNYISMFIGLYILVPYLSNKIGYDFWGNNTSLGHYSYTGFAIGMGIAFLVSIISEFPFFYIAQRKSSRVSFLKTLKYTFLAQIISYVIIVIYYLTISLIAESRIDKLDL